MVEDTLQITNYFRIHITEQDGGGYVLMPITLRIEIHPMPTNCGIRVLSQVWHGMWYSQPTNQDKGLPKVSGNNGTIQVQKMYGAYKMVGRDRVIKNIDKKRLIKLLGVMFTRLAKKVTESYKYHQFLISDQLTKERSSYLTMHFARHLQRQGIGKVFEGPVTFNANYIAAYPPSFIQSWVWVPPNCPILEMNKNKINLKDYKVFRLLVKNLKKNMGELFGPSMDSWKNFNKCHYRERYKLEGWIRRNSKVRNLLEDLTF